MREGNYLKVLAVAAYGDHKVIALFRAIPFSIKNWLWATRQVSKLNRELPLDSEVFKLTTG
jgi:hypothetical protein